MAAKRLLTICSFGAQHVQYAAALRLQVALAELVKQDRSPDILISLQHSPVYTVGKRGTEADFKVSPDQLRQQGIDIYHIPRGGETTFHGPGQLVLYPIINLRRLRRGARRYVEGLEDIMIRTCGAYGICARVEGHGEPVCQHLRRLSAGLNAMAHVQGQGSKAVLQRLLERPAVRDLFSADLVSQPHVLLCYLQGRVPGRTGVWVGERKIGAVGVRISQGIATHGIALNVNTDLAYFDHIVACGIADKEVTTLAQLLGHQLSLEGAARQLIASTVSEMNFTDFEVVQPEDLMEQAGIERQT